MNIYLINCQNTYNYGSMMMCENFIHYSRRFASDKNIRYYVETESSEHIQRLIEATGIDTIYPVRLNALFIETLNGRLLAEGFLGIRKIVTSLAGQMDLAIVLGGDDFTEDYGWKGPVRQALKLNVLKRHGLPVILLGQTMGPFQSFRRPVMRWLLKSMDRIYARDGITCRYLADLGLANVSLVDDLALLPLARQEQEPEPADYAYITFCPSELIYRYSRSGNREEWIEFNRFMISRLLHQFPEQRLVLLAHVLAPAHVDDRVIVDELYESIRSLYGDRILRVTEATFPYEVRKYIRKSLLTVSSRMHPVVSALQCAVPAIALSYSSKYWGIIGERYGLGSFLLDVRQLDYDAMQARFIHCLEQIEANRPEIVAAIRQKNEEAKTTIECALNEIVGTKAGSQ